MFGIYDASFVRFTTFEDPNEDEHGNELHDINAIGELFSSLGRQAICIRPPVGAARELGRGEWGDHIM